MSDKEITHYAWIDVETTGLDKGRDPIIEIACVITDTEMKENVATFSTPVNPGPGLLNARLEVNPYVKEMHTKNGLLAAIENGEGMPVDMAETQIIAMLSSRTQIDSVMLAGSGVSHFDKGVLEMQMPVLSQWFYYRPLDIGNIRSFIEYTLKRPDLMPAKEESQHRALPDVLYALKHARYYRDCIGDLPVKALDEEG